MLGRCGLWCHAPDNISDINIYLAQVARPNNQAGIDGGDIEAARYEVIDIQRDPSPVFAEHAIQTDIAGTTGVVAIDLYGEIGAWLRRARIEFDNPAGENAEVLRHRSFKVDTCKNAGARILKAQELTGAIAEPSPIDIGASGARVIETTVVVVFLIEGRNASIPGGTDLSLAATKSSPEKAFMLANATNALITNLPSLNLRLIG